MSDQESQQALEEEVIASTVGQSLRELEAEKLDDRKTHIAILDGQIHSDNVENKKRGLRRQKAFLDKENQHSPIKGWGETGRSTISVEEHLKTESDKDPEESTAEPESLDFNENINRFHELIKYIDGDRDKVEDTEKIVKFAEETDNLERLNLLRTMPLADAIKCIYVYSTEAGPGRYLSKRLTFYQDLIQGRAVHREHYEQWDSEKRQNVQMVSEIPIDANSVTPASIGLGVLRDVAYAAMVGTPELAAFKIANRRCKDRELSTNHMPNLKEFDHESVGRGYVFLEDLYDKATNFVKGKDKESKLSPQELEHKSVMVAAGWLQESMDYNDPARTERSPYTAKIEEAVAWSRLGERIKKQFRGMRQKIQDTELYNIGRFIGKSGDNIHGREKHSLTKKFEILSGDPTVDVERKNELTSVENILESQELTKKHEVEIAREQTKFGKKLNSITNLQLPKEEEGLQIDSVVSHHEQKMARLRSDFSERLVYLQNRTPDQLLEDIASRKEIVNRRYEEAKSLAQMATDLHFAFQSKHFEDENKDESDRWLDRISGTIDWINHAPFGTIKRSHRMLQKGISKEVVFDLAVTDMIIGKQGLNREKYDRVHNLIAESGGNWEKMKGLRNMVRVGNILSSSGYEATIDEVADLAGKDHRGLKQALDHYSLGEVKSFIDNGVNLNSVVIARDVTQKFNFDLSIDVITEMARHDLKGLGEALREFSLDSVKILLSQDVNLIIATSISNLSKQFGNEVSLPRISAMAKNCPGTADLRQALNNLSFEEAEKMYSKSVWYTTLSEVSGVLDKHGQILDFDSQVGLSGALVSNGEREHQGLDKALDVFSLDEINKVLTEGKKLSDTISVKEQLVEKGIQSDLEEVITFTKFASNRYHPSAYVSDAIDQFGIDSVRYIIQQGCYLNKVLSVKEYSEAKRPKRGQDPSVTAEVRETIKMGGLELMLAIARFPEPLEDLEEVFVKTLKMGFTTEDIIKFPFLVSPLLNDHEIK